MHSIHLVLVILLKLVAFFVYQTLLLLLLFVFWITPSDSQRLLLTLHSRIRPEGAQETILDARDQTLVGCVRASALSSVLLLLPHSVS